MRDVLPYDASVWAVSQPAAFYPSTAATPVPGDPYGGGVELGWFSATCYFFGRRLYRHFEGAVPVGLVDASWGGQSIETFMSPDALADASCGFGAAAEASEGESEEEAAEAPAEAAEAPEEAAEAPEEAAADAPEIGRRSSRRRRAPSLPTTTRSRSPPRRSPRSARRGPRTGRRLGTWTST